MSTINIDKRQVPVTARNKRIYPTTGTSTSSSSTITGGGGSGMDYAYVDGSLATRDVSINWLKNNTWKTSTFLLKEASLNMSKFKWNTGLLEPSVGVSGSVGTLQQVTDAGNITTTNIQTGSISIQHGSPSLSISGTTDDTETLTFFDDGGETLSIWSEQYTTGTNFIRTWKPFFIKWHDEPRMFIDGTNTDTYNNFKVQKQLPIIVISSSTGFNSIEKLQFIDNGATELEIVSDNTVLDTTYINAGKPFYIKYDASDRVQVNNTDVIIYKPLTIPSMASKLVFSGTDASIYPADTTSAGKDLAITAGAHISSGNTGGTLYLTGGKTGGSSGNAGNVRILGGQTTAPSGTGGSVYIDGNNGPTKGSIYIGTNTSTAGVYMGSLPSSTTSNVLYYNTATKQLSYGAASGGTYNWNITGDGAGYSVASGDTMNFNDSSTIIVSASKAGNQIQLSFNVSTNTGVTSFNTRTGAVTLLTGDVTPLVLTGFATGANTTITASDTIETAFEKAQGQINQREPSLGNPTMIASILASNTSGVRNWQPAPVTAKLASASATSGTGEVKLFSAAIPANRVVTAGDTFRIHMVGNSSSTGTLIFRVRVGANNSTADTQCWISTTSVAQVANARAGFDVMVTLRSATSVNADGVGYAGAVVLPTLIAAPAAATIASSSNWFIVVTATCSVGTFTTQNCVIEQVF